MTLEIRQEIARYADGTFSAADLEDRLEEVAWDLETEPERTLAADALRLLAEHSNRDWTDEELKQKLVSLSQTYWFQQAPKVAWSGSATGITLHQESAAAGTPRAVVSG